MNSYFKMAVAAVAATALTACANRSGTLADAPECQVGAPAYVIGAAVLGAIAGAALSNNRGQGAALGATAGAVAGMVAGNFVKERCKKLEEASKRMSTITLAAKEIEVREPSIAWIEPSAGSRPSNQKIDEGVATVLRSNAMFESGSARLTPSAVLDIQTLASAYSGTTNKILIVGHTDGLGDSANNLALSEQRAREVGNILAANGVPRWNIYFKGAGATQPVGDNATEVGRALNRRVEVVELKTEAGVAAYDAKQDTNIGFLDRSTQNREVTVVELAPPVTSSTPTVMATQPTPEITKFAKSLRPGADIDLGGKPVDGRGVAIEPIVGEKAKPGLFSGLGIIGKAFASNDSDLIAKSSCLADANKQSGTTRSLANGQAISTRTSDYIPGLYGTSWQGMLNGNLTGIANIKVLKNGAQADSMPQVVVFRDYKPGDEKPTIQSTGTARSFEGKNGLLYRVFLGESAWPLRCIDVVFDTAKPGTTKFGRLYYDRGEVVHVVDYTPTILDTRR
jgi:outer membrane protein OmpA-like peptidoglycan-associated protein